MGLETFDEDRGETEKVWAIHVQGDPTTYEPPGLCVNATICSPWLPRMAACNQDRRDSDVTAVLMKKV